MIPPRATRLPTLPPKLTFFCELEPKPLAELFARPDVLPALARLRAGVSLGLIDLSAERAAVVRRLNAAGVPVTAWLLLAYEDGYFQHLDNLPQTVARYGAFREWARREGLAFAGIGLDIEQDRRDLERFGREPWRAVPVTLRRALDGARLDRGLEGYRALVARMRGEGWRVETYQFPSIADDRRAGSRLLQRAFGMMDLAVDREVWMLYSSILPPRGPGWLLSYGPEAEAIAVGSTGGGIDGLPKLTWEDLRRDLLLARRWTDDLYVFSLEGCLEQGFLERIGSLDWSQSASQPIPGEARRPIDALRLAMRLGLRASATVERAAARVERAGRRLLGSARSPGA